LNSDKGGRRKAGGKSIFSGSAQFFRIGSKPSSRCQRALTLMHRNIRTKVEHMTVGADCQGALIPV
jgi:hypothetical protein